MALTTDDRVEPELKQTQHEEGAAALAEAAGASPDATQAEPGATEGDEEEPELPALRLAVAVAFPVIAAAIMVGGVFLGTAPRFSAALGGLLGIGLAVLAHRVRRPLAANVLILAGLVAIGLLTMVPMGPGNILAVSGLVREAATAGDVLRPPVPFTAGWAAIVGWLMGIVGFATAWVAVAVRRPSLALLLPLPVAALGGISVPSAEQVPSGLAVLVLFAIGLGLLASTTALGDGDERPPLSYEIRKALRSLPLMVVIVAALFALSKADFLFPAPAIDPAQEPQKPKATPLSEVPDRPLFRVQSTITGPWRIGSLDVYDGTDWRLPPFAENQLDDVPRSGIVDDELEPGVTARFTVSGLEGAVLPGLGNITGIVADGPRLAYDPRSGNIRVSQGQIQAGLRYTVQGAALPSVEDLRAINGPFPSPQAERFARMPVDPPPAAEALIEEAQAATDTKWDEFFYLYNWLFDNVTATGAGAPTSVTPERVEDIIGGTREATPFEIVATQAMLARWIDVPSRIGYGFDGGEPIGGELEVRPGNGATFVEVYFPGHKWLPVVGKPKKAKPSVGGDPAQMQFDPSVLPSDEVGVQLYLPLLTPAGSTTAENIRNALLLTALIASVVGLTYALWPAVRKARIRSRRRAAAERSGPRARIALAYAEWRDTAADYGFGYPTDTPLMFLDRFIEDAEHTELAWLTTRALWGDLQDEVSPELATTAEELSRALRRRLGQAQPATVRVVAALSRLSLRNPYAPETDLTARALRRRARTEEPALA